jgi:hypothetical protein
MTVEESMAMAVKIAKIETETSNQTVILQEIKDRLDDVPSRTEFNDLKRRTEKSEDNDRSHLIMFLGAMGMAILSAVAAVSVVIAGIIGILPQIHVGGH